MKFGSEKPQVQGDAFPVPCKMCSDSATLKTAGGKKKVPTSGLSAEAAKTKLLKSLCFHSCRPLSPGSFHHPKCKMCLQAAPSQHVALLLGPQGPKAAHMVGDLCPHGHLWDTPGPSPTRRQSRHKATAQARCPAVHRRQHGWFLCGVPAPALEHKNQVWPCNFYICASSHASQGCF